MDTIENVITVLIAERHRAVAQSLARVVTTVENTRVAAEVTDSDAALEVGEKLAPDIAIVDLDLSPKCTLVRGLHERSPDTRIIVLADRGTSEPKALLNALESGAVGIVYKQASLDELVRALGSHRQSPVLAGEAAGMLLNSYLDRMTEKRQKDVATIEALAAALEARDLSTGHHVQRVTQIARSCMERVDASLAHNEEVVFGFMLHDVGKIGVPDAILNKPTVLDDHEWNVMRQHPEIGVKIVEPIGFSSATTEVILHHHERWDGGGYPAGLRGEEIPLTARVFTVADAFDAMTSDRPYRSAMSSEDALATITRDAGRQYDPDVVDSFGEFALTA